MLKKKKKKKICGTQNSLGTLHSDHGLQSSQKDQKQHKNNHEISLCDMCAVLEVL